MDSPDPALQAPTVLVVDDEQTILSVTSRMFRRLNCNVVTAQSADEALEICTNAETRPELALVDQRMPETDGLALIEELVRRDQLPAHVYLISAMSIEDVHHRVQAFDLSGILQKPFHMADLQRILKRHFPEQP